MSTHLARAEMLLHQARPADAEREVGLALAQNPQDPYAHALLALARLEQKRADAALEAAEQAVGLAPDVAYFQRVRAHVLHLLDRDREALAAVDESIRLDPQDEDAFALRASIHLALRDWSAALSAAEAGLAINPEHVSSANMRALALVQLGRREEATATVDHALRRAPEDAFSHANQGWTCLHRGDPKQAQVHFREALRLNPGMEFARTGMLEALKARNPLYRGMLAYYLWMARQSGRMQWAFILGIYVVTRLASSTAKTHPDQGWIFWPVAGLLYAFVYLSWTAGPMFNLLLRLDRFGRFVLSKEERAASNWFGGAVLVVLGTLAWWASGGGELAMACALLAAILSVCVAATVSRTGQARRVLGWSTVALTVCAVVLVGSVFTPWVETFAILWVPFLLGFIGFQIAANTLRR